MGTTKNQAIRKGRVTSTSGDIYEFDIDGLLVEELEVSTPLKMDSAENEDGETIRREEA